MVPGLIAYLAVGWAAVEIMVWKKLEMEPEIELKHALVIVVMWGPILLWQLVRGKI